MRAFGASAVLLAALAATMSACVTTDVPAARLVDAYLQAITDDTADRGWAQLHPVARNELFGGDLQTYLDAMASMSLDPGTWRVVSAVADDPDLYVVEVVIESPDARRILSEQHHRGFLFDLTPGEEGRGRMLVRLSGGPGIWPFGG